MAAGGTVCRQVKESALAEEARGETSTVHERLVAYVHTLTHGSRRGVWGEHSYARARSVGGPRGAGGGPGGQGEPRVRVLLAPRVPSPPRELLDVVTPPSPPPSPPALGEDEERAFTSTEEDDNELWEQRVCTLAPSSSRARLAAAACDLLRGMRLELVAARGRSGRREAWGAAAARLRHALAAHWRDGGAAWLHATLCAHMPRGPRRLYERAVAALRRRAPHLAERLTGESAPVGRGLAAWGPPVGPESSPWLVWVQSGVPTLDARWERRLAALVHTRVLRVGSRGMEPAPPEQWCAAAAGAVRSQLTDALAEAGSRSVVVGGVGCGAAVALLLARGAGGAGGAGGGVRGAVLCAPPLLTAEGGRGAPDDPLHHCRLPLLLIVGTAASNVTRHIANNLAESGWSRRVLEVRGCDEELRLPRRLRLRYNLPQEALDAALVEECVRWAVETAEQEEPGSPPSPAPAPAPSPSATLAPRRSRLPSIVREIDLTEEEYSHLPPAALPPPPAAQPPPPPPPPPSPASSPAQNLRHLEIVEGRMVSRGSGKTPLALLPPRRAPAPTPAPAPGAGPGAALAAADIMQLPIVFADDEEMLPAANQETSPPAAGASLTVTSGKSKRGGGVVVGGAGSSVKFTRVILAKRGARGAAGPGGSGARGAGGAPRRLLLRRGMRIVTRPDQ